MKIFPKKDYELILKFALLVCLSALSVRGLGESQKKMSAPDRIDAEFTDLMEHAEGILVRVPINTLTEENTDLAEIRFLTNFVEVSDPKFIPFFWESAVTYGRGTNSSSGNWSAWGGLGWARPGYFQNFRPNFKADRNSWHYGSPVNRIVLDMDGLYRNYYYYPRTLYW